MGRSVKTASAQGESPGAGSLTVATRVLANSISEQQTKDVVSPLSPQIVSRSSNPSLQSASQMRVMSARTIAAPTAVLPQVAASGGGRAVPMNGATPVQSLHPYQQSAGALHAAHY